MPLLKADDKLVYYAHVPKCGGMSVGRYLTKRFGALAFHDSRQMRHDSASRWSRTSPQHIDRESLARLFPAGFFDAVFTIVRHPVSRIVSAYHFQLEVEQSIPASMEFSDWLADMEERLKEDPFAFDNHIRPMSDIVPEPAVVFHVEHGLDALVPWFDVLTGTRAGPRALPRVNAHGAYSGGKTGKAVPGDSDLARIARLYAVDFDRFGYEIGSLAPAAAPPELDPETVADRDAALAAMRTPMARLKRQMRRLKRRTSRLLD